MFLLASLALASTDDIGGNATEDAQGGVMKLVSVEVAEAAVVTTLELAVSGSSEEEVVLVLYVRDDRGYQLLKYLDADEVVDGYATSGDVRWLLEPGEIYALGAYVGTGFSCFYDEASASPWFGEVVEGYQVAGVAPETFRGTGEPAFFQMRLTSEDADFDGDGAISTHWGGTDCDDSDADVIDATEEIPYDRIDQDCDGEDLIDIDRDGHAATEAGGPDCDDSTGAISPSALEVCEDGVDNDCLDGDAVCVDEQEEEVIDEGVGTTGACGCAAAPRGAALLGLGGLALLAARRRED